MPVFYSPLQCLQPGVNAFLLVFAAIIMIKTPHCVAGTSFSAFSILIIYTLQPCNVSPIITCILHEKTEVQSCLISFPAAELGICGASFYE